MTTEESTVTEETAARRPLTAIQRGIVASLTDSDPSMVPKAVSYLRTEVFSSQAYFELEQKTLFRGKPVPIEVSAALPKPKMHVINEDYGTSVLLTRDDTGKMHAFLNVCMHRCIQLSREKQAKSGGLIVCPYHAWSYNMRGELVGVPREDVFPGLDRKKHSLKRLECVEAGGLIWVNLDPNTTADFSIVAGDLAAEFDAIGLPKQVVYTKARYEIAANWKFVHDAFLENYHIPRLHSKSLGSMFVDRPTAFTQIGPHLLQSSTRAGYKAEQGAGMQTFEDFRASGVFSYTLIPGSIVITSPTYINVMFLSPQSADKTVINYYMLVDRMPETEKEKARCEKSIELMQRVTTDEDFWVSELGTIGVKTGAVEQLTLGGMEQDVATFHKVLEEQMGLTGG
jgi:phenylpropionate dioxygenase-like ring-hydroxylating dioxygenase large terminal subunit